MSTITVYHKPTWTTRRQVYAALKESGVDFDAVDPPQAPKLRWHDAIVRPRRTPWAGDSSFEINWSRKNCIVVGTRGSPG